MSCFQNSSHSLAISEEQDSLDNIIVEDDYNQQDDVDSLKSFSSFDVEGEDQNENQEDDDEDQEEEENQNYSKDQDRDAESSHQEDEQLLQEKQLKESAIILKRIQEKKGSIFQLVHRSKLSTLTIEQKNGNLSKKRSSASSNSSKLFQNSEFSCNQILKREILNYSRREKSLEELSKKFLSLFLDKEESMLSLDKITNQLGVERRRIYDIINILESLKLVSRKGKNNYKWNGFQKIYETISQFDSKTLTKKEEQELTQEPQKREKSLEMLSIGFLKLFLHWKCTMTLEEAARKLSSKQIDDHKIKTKIRRLYDIANVFKSLGLIKKTSLIETKKPAFEWIGIVGLDSFAYKIMKEKKTGLEEKDSASEEENFNQTSQQNISNAAEPKLSKKRFSNDKSVCKTNSNTNSIGEKQQLKKSFIIQQQLKEQREKERQLTEQNNQKQTIESTILTNNENITSNTNNTNNFISNFPQQLIQTISKQIANQQQQQQQQQLSNPNFQQQQNTSQLQAQLQLLSRPILQSITNNINNLNNNNNNNNNINNQNISIQSDDKSNINNNGNNLIGNIMLKCFQNILTNLVNKNINNLQNKQQSQFPQQNININEQPKEENIENNFEESPEKVLKINNYNQTNQNSAFMNNWSSNTKSSSNNKYLLSSQKSSSNLGDFTTAKKQKSDINQMINDENIPLSGDKNSLLSNQFNSINASNLKTPILKRTLTIIQPKLDENEDTTPTPPTCKRSFSACYSSSQTINNGNTINASNLFQNLNQIGGQQQQQYSNLFADKTNHHLHRIQNNQINNINQQQQQSQASSSFKKIRKLTYENNSLSGSDNKQNDMIELKKSCSFDNQINCNQVNFNTLIQNSHSLLKNPNFQINQLSSNNIIGENNSLIGGLSNININQLNVLQNKRVLEHYF